MNRRFLVEHVLRPYKWPLLFAFVAMLFETLAGLLQPWPLKVVLDSVIGHHPLPGFLSGLHDVLGRHKGGTIAVAAIATVAIALLNSVASYADSYLTTSVGQYLAHDLRKKVYHHLQRLSLSYYDHHKLGNILSTITDDINNVQAFFSTSILSIVIDATTIVGMFGVMLYLDWKFTLIAMAVTPFLFLFVQRFTHLVKQSTKQVRAKQSEIVSTVEESLGAIRVIQAFAQGDIEEEKLSRRSLESVDAALSARKIKALLGPVMDVVAAIGTALVLWYGASLVLANEMTAGSLVVFLLYLGKMFKPMQDLAKMTNSASKAAVGMDRIQEILESDALLPESADAKPAPKLTGNIAFEHVAFGYDPGKLILQDVHFEIPAGKMGAVVGPTGEGKSTLINLIPRLYDPAKGTVRIDGHDLRDFQLKSLRDQISYVQQETVLFDEPIWQNIAYGKPDATREEIVQAAEARQRRRVHPEAAERLRHRGRRAGRGALRGAAPAHRHRPGDHPKFADPHSRRGHLRPRRRVGVADRRGARPADEGENLARHRTPARNDQTGRPDHGAEGRPDRRAGLARRAARPRGAVRAAVHPPVRRPGGGRRTRPGR